MSHPHSQLSTSQSESATLQPSLLLPAVGQETHEGTDTLEDAAGTISDLNDTSPSTEASIPRDGETFDSEGSTAIPSAQTSLPANINIESPSDEGANGEPGDVGVPTIFIVDRSPVLPSPSTPSSNSMSPFEPLSNPGLQNTIEELSIRVSALFGTFAMLAEAFPALRDYPRIKALEEESQEVLSEGRDIEAEHNRWEASIRGRLHIFQTNGTSEVSRSWQNLLDESRFLRRERAIAEAEELRIMEEIAIELCDLAGRYVEHGGSMAALQQNGGQAAGGH